MTVTKADLIEILKSSLKSFIYGSQGAQLQQKAGTHELLVEDTGQNIREALREEDSWRKGIKWFLGSCIEVKAKGRGRAPYLLSDPYYAEKLPNGNYLVTDQSAHQVLEVTPSYTIVWAFGEFNVSGADLTHLNNPWRAVYNEDLNTVLISDTFNGRIIELNYATRAVLHTLTATATGILSRPIAEYGHTGRILVCDSNRHYVSESDWAGTILWDYGLYGVVGTALNRLWFPHSADYEPFGDRFIIADYYNHRVLNIRRDKVVEFWSPCLYPNHVKVFNMTSHFGIGSWQDSSYLMEPSGLMIWYSPHRSNMVVETEDQTVLTAWDMNVYEYDLRTHKPWRRSNSFAETSNLLAAVESRIFPIHAFGTRAVTIQAYSDQVATLRIYMPNTISIPSYSYPASAGLVPTDPWRLYQEEPIQVNKLVSKTVLSPTPFLGVSVLMGSVAGTAKITFHEEGRY